VYVSHLNGSSSAFNSENSYSFTETEMFQRRSLRQETYNDSRIRLEHSPCKPLSVLHRNWKVKGKVVPVLN
jgi:hypothetical protein